jgi:hypothetical protein
MGGAQAEGLGAGGVEVEGGRGEGREAKSELITT